MNYKERVLANFKHHKKKLCVRHIPEVSKSSFAGFLCSNKYHAPLFIKFGVKVCDFVHIQCSYGRLLSQKISRDEEFAVSMLNRLDSDPRFLKRVCFSGESISHASGMLNRHNSRIRGSDNPQETQQLERYTPKVKVYCRTMHNIII